MAEARAIAVACLAALLAATPVGKWTTWPGPAAASEGDDHAQRGGPDTANSGSGAAEESAVMIDVIVTLRLPPEADQSDTAAIEAAQDALIADLQERNVKVGAIRRLRFIPAVTVRLPIESAGALLQSPHVSAIEPDRLIPLPETPDSGSKAE